MEKIPWGFFLSFFLSFLSLHHPNNSLANLSMFKLHGYTVHQIMLNTFYYQLTHTTLKNVELLKHSKINKNTPTCAWQHIQDSIDSRLKEKMDTLYQKLTHTPYRVSPILSFWIIIYIFHTYPLLQSQYAAITLTKPCTSFTHLLLTKRVILAKYWL